MILEEMMSNSTKFEKDVRAVMQELGDLLIQKHYDYGPKNIAESPGGPINGLRVRMWDKLARINNLFDKKDKTQLNYNIIKDYGNNQTWERNRGKRMLTLIISKSTLFWLDKAFYYINFLSHYDIEAFIYNYGIFKDKLIGTESK